jgi:hypothetical protein
MTRTTGVRTIVIALGTVVAIVGIGACTSSGGASSRTAGLALDGAGGGANQAAAGAPAGSVSAGSASKGSVNNGSVNNGSVNNGSVNNGSQNAAVGDLALSSAKIRNADLTVAVKRGQSVAATADSAEAITVRTGGEVDADERTSGPGAAATLVLLVPPDRLSAVLDELSRLGIEKSRHLSTEDVTSKVADVASRVSSARVSIARLRALFQHAVKISDVITIESELSGRESDLESLEAQQRALTAQTATATVTLSLITPAAALVQPAITHRHRHGFLGGLQNGWTAFSGGANWLVTAFGALLPFVLLLVVVGLAGRLLWPRIRPARRPAPAPVGPPVE